MDTRARAGIHPVGTAGSQSASENEAGPFGVYFGWYNVAIAVVCIMVSVGSTSYAYGLFIKPVSAELGLSRANTNIGLILFHLGSALASPFVGRLLDQYPLRLILTLANLLFVSGMVGVAMSSSPLAIGFFVFLPIALGTVGIGSLFGVVLVSRWFTTMRSRAISIMALGTSLGGMIVFPLIALFMALLGWRSSLLAVAALVGSVVFVASLMIRPRPDAGTASRLSEQSHGPDDVRLTQRDILANRDFWLIAIPVALMLGVDQSMLATVTPYMLDRSMGLPAAASVMSATTASAIAGKILIAWIADRSDLRLLLGLTAVFGIIQCLTLLFDPGYTVILGVSLLTGLAVGGTYPLASAIVAQRFGAASVGSAVGLTMPIVSASAISSLYFVGAVYDRNGSYSFAFMIFAGAFALAICILPFVRRHSPLREQGHAD